ncbi:MAG: DUF4476 domain-containing protein [Bacteroidales bacterium]|nr:DUF4476 domain-containing protein [Bacteroidales bacterium]
MKRVIVFLSLVLFTTTGLLAQNRYNTIFYTENGEMFWIILNGVRQNENAETNVKVTDLNASMYQLKVLFEDTTLGEIDKTLLMPESSAEITYRIRQNKKGEYVVKYFTDTPLHTTATQTSGQHTVSFLSSNRYPVNPWEQTSVTSTTTTTTNPPDNVESHINMNIGENGVNVDVSINDPQVYSETTVTTSTTTISTVASPDHYVMNGYGGPIGCPWPMEEQDFYQAKQTIASKTFEDSKLQIAKQIISSNCLFADQVRDIMTLFEFEDSRLDFAKYSYARTYDQGNYFKVNDAFEFELSIEELNDFIDHNK